MTPDVNESVWALRPDFVALSIVVRGGRNAPSREPVPGPAARPSWADSHLAAWRDAYEAFGAKPKRTPCSAEALWRRIGRDGAIPPVNALVDLYNAISLRYAVPVGGEDLTAYAGVPRLVRAAGGEPFETTRDGEPAIEAVDPGEVVWRDDLGVTCRRWNWRQTPRTRLEVTSTEMWFVLERLEPMPVASLVEAGDALIAGVRRFAPTAQIATALIAS